MGDTPQYTGEGHGLAYMDIARANVHIHVHAHAHVCLAGLYIHMYMCICIRTRHVVSNACGLIKEHVHTCTYL